MATEVVNVPDLDLQFFGNDGKPMASGHVVFFRNGTDIPESVYTSDGETALGNTIELDASGFPVVQFSLIADKKYTVKAFDKDNVLVWTRNDIQGTICGGQGPTGDFIPMDGTTLSDPVRGSIVWKDGSYVGTANQHGMVLTDTRTGAAILGREGLDTVVGDLEGDYRNYQAKLINTQNGFPGYPDFAELTTRALTLNEETSQNGTRVSKQIDIRPSITATGENKITSKGHLSIENYPGNNISIVASNNLLLQGYSVMISPNNSGDVIIGNDGKLITKTLGIGTNLNNKAINDIWTSTSTGAPSDSQLITAKAALAGGGMTNPMTDEGDMIIGGASGAPTRLQFGTSGQLLVMGASGKPEWSDKPAACQENYSILDSTGVYSASSYNDQLLTSKVIANVDRTYSQLGFGLKAGQTGVTGKFGLAIYDVGKNLVARTPIFQLTENYLGEIYWVDTESTFKLNAGDEYFFAFWCTDYPASNLCQFLGHQQVSTFDANLVGIIYGQSGLTEMPNSLGTLSYGQMVVYMAVR